MIREEQVFKYRALEAWFHGPQGFRLAQAFLNELNSLSTLLKGDSMIQLGSCGRNLWLSGMAFKKRWVVSPGLYPAKSAIFSYLDMLPFENESLDCVLAPLTLESSDDYHALIDEMDRVLKPFGYMVILGVNPWSFWGLAMRLNGVDCFGGQSVFLRSSLSVRSRLLTKGYRQCLVHGFYYIPPVFRQKTISKLEFLNEMGKMLWPYPSGFYYLIARKYDEGMMLVPGEIFHQRTLIFT